MLSLKHDSSVIMFWWLINQATLMIHNSEMFLQIKGTDKYDFGPQFSNLFLDKVYSLCYQDLSLRT